MGHGLGCGCGGGRDETNDKESELYAGGPSSCPKIVCFLIARKNQKRKANAAAFQASLNNYTATLIAQELIPQQANERRRQALREGHILAWPRPVGR